MSTLQPAGTRIGTREALAAPAYFAVYLAYLFWNPESELLHWLSLVVGPLLIVLVVRSRGARGPSAVLASFGLRRGNLTGGLWWAIGVAVVVAAVQLLLARVGDDAWALIRSGRALYLWPIAFVLALLTAGATEEFFFRGFLQTRLEVLLRSRIAALVVATAFFGLYHLPYAYLNPHWPSAGDWSEAWRLAMTNGALGGLILGGLYIVTKRNLFACILVHAFIDSVVLMTMIKFSSG
jgi:membrane protease YdiL (CAAX protease family)